MTEDGFLVTGGRHTNVQTDRLSSSPLARGLLVLLCLWQCQAAARSQWELLLLWLVGCPMFVQRVLHKANLKSLKTI